MLSLSAANTPTTSQPAFIAETRSASGPSNPFAFCLPILDLNLDLNFMEPIPSELGLNPRRRKRTSPTTPNISHINHPFYPTLFDPFVDVGITHPPPPNASRNPSPRPSTSSAPVSASDPPPKKKRRRQALSCTECKRRKIRCDRVQPCAPCNKRGEGDKCRWHILDPVCVGLLRVLRPRHLHAHSDE